MVVVISLKKNRVNWLDYAKGIGILLVVLDHTISGLLNSQLISYSSLELQIKIIYSGFFMPLFFIIAGLFAEKSISKPFFTVLTTKLRTLAYPYIIWSVVQKILLIAAAQHINSPALSNPAMFAFNMVFQPYQQLWFIYALLIISLTHLGLRKLGLSPFYFLLFGACIYFSSVNRSNLPFIVTQLQHYTIFFSLGAWIGSALLTSVLSRLDLLFDRRTLLATTLGGYGFIIAVSFLPLVYDEKIKVLIRYLLTGSVGSLATLALCLWLAQNFKAHHLAFLSFLGRSSLEIYVAHLIFIAGGRIILWKGIGITNSMLHLVSGMIFSLSFPVILKVFFQRIGFRYAFTFPASHN